MTSPSPVFGATDPVDLVRDWLASASETEVNDPNAIALATVDPAGVPNVRIVLLKEIDDEGFVFYTNYESRKGSEIAATGQAAFTMHWKSCRRQVRARGPISRIPDERSDAYFASRPLDSRLGAWASIQSQPLADRGALETRIEEARARFGENPPRPPHWGGFMLTPLEIEFWADVEFRLHDREAWRRDDLAKSWSARRLFP
ncbi:pyridoxamine 5'-phosphate oxidase [Palleronia aestuarii]|uniref:Pyridoxine/pyridoxamine 5'-phosphate oxidase n=1 Tax=Palleronia aestuarii TaxID=568105 RepID=A0A2W7NAA9_9RHOB|nr:pyridoxamine 5'-phosphate oxidase [Palleronia aestuarii]